LRGPFYIATESFGPWCGKRWTSYLGYSGLTQVREIVSLDNLLCPTLLKETHDEDWAHIVNENFMLHFFTDLEYLRYRCREEFNHNLLCLIENPDQNFNQSTIDPGFVFKGYDLVDLYNGNSALTNCGGFPLVFQNSELSEFGLISQLSRAIELQRELPLKYPDQPHAKCKIWLISRFEI
jgi:hypothetical protein